MRFFCFLFCLGLFYGDESLGLNDAASQLFKDLKKIQEIDRKIHDQLPLMINYQLQGGYFTMPSARTYPAGTLGASYAYVPPYNLWSLGFQFFDHIEATGNYWVYTGQTEGSFGHLGFGDDAERAANLKLLLLRESDGFPFLPTFALGWNDFLGGCRFYSFYAAMTKEILPWNLEVTLGWGQGRIKGFYGGLAWTPWHRTTSFLKGLTLAAEYDANDYHHHRDEHPKGRDVASRINVGAQLDLWNLFRLSASSLRGNHWASSVALHYDLGSSPGLFPKIYDVPGYTAPVNHEPIDSLRSEKVLGQELAFALKEQGFDLYSLYLVPNQKEALWMKVVNVRYREEVEVRRRIQMILGELLPSNIAQAVAVIEAEGIAEHEYQFRAEDLKRYVAGQMGDSEFQVISPLKEASCTPSRYDASLLYQRHKPIWMLTFRPWTRTFFGSARGKLKYEVGFSLGSEGYFFNQMYYALYGSYTAFASTQHLSPRDTMNPSRIINVRTDAVCYNQASSFHVDQAFIQKSVNWGRGWFSRLAVGYFETAYAGVSLESLYYPVQTDWAIGFEVSTLLKRNYYGLGFQHKIRKLTSEGYRYFPYTGLQYFLELYYQYKPLNLDFKISAGQFLARDKGIRIEGGRNFQSGLRVGLWYTLTNANDVINNKRYYDKGFSITLPLDVFLNKTSRTRIGYSMSAWLRDCGGRAASGKQLYPTLYWERYNYKPGLY